MLLGVRTTDPRKVMEPVPKFAMIIVSWFGASRAHVYQLHMMVHNLVLTINIHGKTSDKASVFEFIY